ncbi:biotin transport system substrate-specific component [Aurantimicrobium minutum]|uniref:biotin transporter BioY n=1 Tax=Aurantimicrobium minutum TaxID=708131 RepID=UPI00247561AD|nr:biotin transporter BioY [Aurantimicrobium minutum]MDH6277803.1 biotin transport system substrate-specific component [Aurantimicrobium minutum]
MSSIALASPREVLVDRWVAKSVTADLAVIAAGAALTAGAAQLVIPMWPVPITGQTFAVLFVGATLGSLRGALSMLLYVGLGVAGLPVFAEGGAGLAKLAGPTGGYMIGFVLAAALVGWLAQKQWDRKVLGTIGAFLAGTAVIYAVGLPWLSVALGQLGYPNDLSATLQAGLYPFIPGDLIKALAAGGLLPLVWKLTTRTK